MDRILIIGGGLVGSVLAMYLSRLGHEVTATERHPDRRDRTVPGGRSINLTLCERGLAPLEKLGIRKPVQELGIPALGRILHGVDGDVTYQPYGNQGECLYSVPRSALHRTLIDLAEESFGVRFLFDMECLSVDLDQPAAEFVRSSGETVSLTADRIFGTDGAYSTVRLAMQRQMYRFDLSQEHVQQVYKELRAPPTEAGDWPLDPSALHIWPRQHYMLIGFANPDRSFTLAFHLPLEGRPSLASLESHEELMELFASSFPDALPLIPDLGAQYFGRKPASMVTVRCFPWIYEDRLALAGDAAHAIVPSYGQGANSGFEDCAILDECLAETGGDWSRALPAYQERRKPHTDAIARLALDHFHELKDLVGDADFQLRKKLELRLGTFAAARYTPLYNLVSFTSIPYLEALEMDRRQRHVIDQLMEIEGIEEAIDEPGFEEFLVREHPRLLQVARQEERGHHARRQNA